MSGNIEDYKQQIKRSARSEGFIDKIPEMDKVRATKLVIYGIVIALLFGLVMITSSSVAANADDWEQLADKENEMSYWNGDIGYNEYVERREEIEHTRWWMVYQAVIIGNAARLGVFIGFLMVFIGFMAFATNEQIDKKTRRICLAIAGMIIIGILLTLVIGAQIVIYV